MKKSDYEQLLRLMITGQTVGPNIYKIMEVLGREEVLYRISKFLPLSSNGRKADSQSDNQVSITCGGANLEQ